MIEFPFVLTYIKGPSQLAAGPNQRLGSATVADLVLLLQFPNGLHCGPEKSSFLKQISSRIVPWLLYDDLSARLPWILLFLSGLLC
jgi:hypothetical protein